MRRIGAEPGHAPVGRQLDGCYDCYGRFPTQIAGWPLEISNRSLARPKRRSSFFEYYDMGPHLFEKRTRDGTGEGGVCQAPTQSPLAIIRTRSKA